LSKPIEDYAMLSDCRSVALIDDAGSIDWLCWPSMDSPAMLCSLLGTEDNGSWSIRPSAHFKSSRRYSKNTLVLETEFSTSSGRARLTDWLAIDSSDRVLYRLIEGLEGEINFESRLLPRFDYGSFIPWISKCENGARAVAGPDAIVLHATVPVHAKAHEIVSKFTVRADESQSFAMTWEGLIKKKEMFHLEPSKSLRATTAWWQEWSNRCTYHGPNRDLVLRSLLTLKGLIDRESGGIVAASTTSLPEKLGGERNWDYRFCWIRDSTYTLYSLLMAGYKEEALAWRKWLERAIAGDPAQINIMYGIRGERRLPELELDWLDGYENSKPVRAGNAAYKQRQLDIYGELMDTLYLARESGLPPDDEVWSMQKGLLKLLEQEWKNPDEGIWESRGPKRHFTHSKVMAWVAFDRAIRSAENFGLDGELAHWRKLRKEIHDDVCEKAFNSKLDSFTQYYGSRNVDASLLLLGHVGFLDAKDPRFVGTVRRIETELMENGFVRRYRKKESDDGLQGEEGVFLACSFWLVDSYVLIGEREKGEELFHRLIALTNDVGLLSEEYDTHSKRLLGNFPQALSHLSLVSSALNLFATKGPVHDRSSHGTQPAE
jgi:GH15 family glucan-1,4-alpha-glucosidase